MFILKYFFIKVKDIVNQWVLLRVNTDYDKKKNTKSGQYTLMSPK